MMRSIFAAMLAALMVAAPSIALAQTDMVTYSDTLRKKSGAHSAVHPVKRGAVSAKHGGGSHPVGKARHGK
jgi:hypothetical protein